MYKAKINIGDYKEGQIVPDELAETWSKMYLVSPVEKVEDEIPQIEVPEIKVPEKLVQIEEPSQSGQEKSEDTSGDLLDDYLGRNTSVVVKNIQTDKLNKQQLKKILGLEKSGKNRRQVVKALEKRIEGI